MIRNVLIVDDEATIRRSLARTLTGSGYSVLLADSAQSALEIAQKQDPDLVLLDVCLPDDNGLEVLTQLKEINQKTVIIAMTAYESAGDAVLAMKRGAYDYLCKPFNIESIRLLIKKALAHHQPLKQKRYVPGQAWQKSACERTIATSPAMERIIDMIHRLPTESSSNVLLEGETGTGKELLSRIVHESSSRSDEPFMPICCASIPKDLIESELFGYDKGAYTGARPEGKVGIFEQAGQGTVFLDEIGEMDLTLQVKLLRVLEAREFHPVGSLKRIPLRARIVAATSRNLREEVEAGRFRADLYYRLNVLRIVLPPLRDRCEDIIPLAETFMAEFNAAFNKEFSHISEAARKILMKYSWPGNVRELRNVIERIVLLESGQSILPEHLPQEFESFKESSMPSSGVIDFPMQVKTAKPVALYDNEKEQIIKALIRVDGNVVKAARLLGLKRGALRYRMERYGIDKKDFEILV